MRPFGWSVTVRPGVGLWAGVELVAPVARAVSEALMARGVLAKDTHATTIRLAPPLTITAEEIDLLADALAASIDEVLPVPAVTTG